MQKLRPILGFGPIGWIASCILLAIIIAALCGYDFQFHYIIWIDKLFGQQFLFWYLYRIHVWHSFMWKEPTFGLIGAGIAICALFIAPGRGRWWRNLVVLAAGILGPPFLIYCDDYFWNRGLARSLGWTGDSYGWYVFLWAIFDLFACVLLWLVTGSRLVFGLILGASVLVNTYLIVQYANTPSGYKTFPTIGPLDSVLGPFWNLVVGTALLWWAIRARMHVRPVGACQHCGYDLRGTSHSRCPECGQTNTPQIATTTANLVMDSPRA